MDNTMIDTPKALLNAVYRFVKEVYADSVYTQLQNMSGTPQDKYYIDGIQELTDDVARFEEWLSRPNLDESNPERFDLMVAMCRFIYEHESLS